MNVILCKTKEINYIALKDGLFHLYFNGFSNPNDFNKILDALYLNFSKELRQNLSDLAMTDSRSGHLELILRVFVSLQEKLSSNLAVILIN